MGATGSGAGNASNLMALSSMTQSVTSLAGAYSQASAMRAQGDYQKSQAETNARLAEMQAKDSIRRGDKESAAYKKKNKQLLGSQRAAMAAQGINIDSGSALDIQTQTVEMGAEDALTIKNNAWREAWGYRVQASNSRSEGSFAEMSGRRSANSTLLTGVMNASSYGLQAVGQSSGKSKKKK